MSDPSAAGATSTRETSADTAARLAFVVGRFNRRLLSATGGLSSGLLSALATVTKLGPMRLAELAQTELVSAPSITRTVAELEARGLVVRSTDPGDGRAALIQVTDEGRQAIARARAARAAVVSELLGHLDTADIDSIENALPVLERMFGGA
jgi:DNA-binding MarR family transcriptional regulator